MRMNSRLPLLPSHQAFFLLKNCLAVPKLTYTLRTVPTYKFLGSLRCFDEEIQRCLSSICNIKTDGTTWLQISLPVRDGGLGLRSTESLSTSAFIASAYSVHRLALDVSKRIWNCIQPTRWSCGRLCVEAEVPEENVNSVQRAWDILVVKKKTSLWDSVEDNVNHQARLRACFAPESGARINALPLVSLGTLLTSSQFCFAVALRVGVPICSAHTSRCGKMADSMGYHALSCKKSVGRIPRKKS